MRTGGNPQTPDEGLSAGFHAGEPHAHGLYSRLNWLRAGVLGANDGIVSTAGLVVGVASATAAPDTLLTAGIAGLVSGGVSMAAGEYVSVSSQRDTERSMLDKEKGELRQSPQAELDELAAIYEEKGLKPATARQVAEELTAHDPVAAHAEAELRIDPEQLTNPWHAAVASAASFTVGALLPLLAVLLAPVPWRIPITFVVVLVALVLTGTVSARIGGAPPARAAVRVVAGGALAMTVTFAIGRLLGAVGF